MSESASRAETVERRARHSLERNESRLALLLLLPSFVVLLVIAIYPLGSVFYTSFTNREFASTREVEYVGLENYANLLGLTIRQLPPQTDEETGEAVIDEETGEVVYERPINILPREPRRYRELNQFSLFGNRYVVGATDRGFVRSVGDTLLFTIMSVLLETILGLIIALVMNSYFPGRGMMRAVMLVPWAVPTAVSSRIWEWMFASSRVGMFNVLFQRLGIGDGQISFLTTQGSQVWAMIAIDVWKTTPFMALLLLAGLQLIPRQIYESAYVDGANKVRQFFSMTLPLLRPTLAVALVFRTLDALRVFDLFQIILAQKRYSMASFTYYQLIDNQAMGYSSASSVIIFLLILLFTVLYVRLVGGTRNEE